MEWYLCSWISSFFGIRVTFLKLIYLPIVLVLAFGIPFYMIFVCTTSSHKVNCNGVRIQICVMVNQICTYRNIIALLCHSKMRCYFKYTLEMNHLYFRTLLTCRN